MKMELSDFTLFIVTTKYYYRPLKTYGTMESVNWPFHNTLAEKEQFLKENGFERYIGRAGSFPETDNKEEATMILILAINDFNSRQ